jgi:hypothetical protein
MKFLVRTPASTPIEPSAERADDLVDIGGECIPAHVPLDAELRKALHTCDADAVRRLTTELQEAADQRKIDRASHLVRLLDVLGDSDLGPANAAASDYLQALSRIKAKQSGLLVRRAAKWSPATVAAALALTYPEALRHTTWVADDQRPAAIRRWIGRVSAFAGTGLIDSRTCTKLLLGGPSATPLPHRALRRGDQAGLEFQAVMDGFKDCAFAGALKGSEFLRLLRTTDEGLDLPQAILSRGNAKHLRSFLDMARGARAVDALSAQEYLDLVTKTAAGESFLGRLCQGNPRDAVPLNVYLHALLKAEQTGNVPADTLAGVLLTRAENGRFFIERASAAQAGAIRRLLDEVPEEMFSAKAADMIRGLLPR